MKPVKGIIKINGIEIPGTYTIERTTNGVFDSKEKIEKQYETLELRFEKCTVNETFLNELLEQGKEMTKAETAIREVLDAHSENNLELRDELSVNYGVELARALEIALEKITALMEDVHYERCSRPECTNGERCLRQELEEIEKVFE